MEAAMPQQVLNPDDQKGSATAITQGIPLGVREHSAAPIIPDEGQPVEIPAEKGVLPELPTAQPDNSLFGKVMKFFGRN